jgi:hypothetical protein
MISFLHAQSIERQCERLQSSVRTVRSSVAEELLSQAVIRHWLLQVATKSVFVAGGGHFEHV